MKPCKTKTIIFIFIVVIYLAVIIILNYFNHFMREGIDMDKISELELLASRYLILFELYRKLTQTNEERIEMENIKNQIITYATSKKEEIANYDISYNISYISTGIDELEVLKKIEVSVNFRIGELSDAINKIEYSLYQDLNEIQHNIVLAYSIKEAQEKLLFFNKNAKRLISVMKIGRRSQYYTNVSELIPLAQQSVNYKFYELEHVSSRGSSPIGWRRDIYNNMNENKGNPTQQDIQKSLEHVKRSILSKASELESSIRILNSTYNLKEAQEKMIILKKGFPLTMEQYIVLQKDDEMLNRFKKYSPIFIEEQLIIENAQKKVNTIANMIADDVEHPDIDFDIAKDLFKGLKDNAGLSPIVPEIQEAINRAKKSLDLKASTTAMSTISMSTTTLPTAMSTTLPTAMPTIVSTTIVPTAMPTTTVPTTVPTSMSTAMPTTIVPTAMPTISRRLSEWLAKTIKNK